jgi:hypothetical protein
VRFYNHDCIPLLEAKGLSEVRRSYKRLQPKECSMSGVLVPCSVDGYSKTTTCPMRQVVSFPSAVPNWHDIELHSSIYGVAVFVGVFVGFGGGVFVGFVVGVFVGVSVGLGVGVLVSFGGDVFVALRVGLSVGVSVGICAASTLMNEPTTRDTSRAMGSMTASKYFFFIRCPFYAGITPAIHMTARFRSGYLRQVHDLANLWARLSSGWSSNLAAKDDMSMHFNERSRWIGSVCSPHQYPAGCFATFVFSVK